MPFQRPKPREPVGEPELFEYAVAALSRRMRTERDLRRLMQPRAYPAERGLEDIDRVIARLVELNYLSDTRFAADFTRIRKEGQAHGRRRVAQDLAVKGVPKELASAALATAYDEADEVALARAYCEKKRIPKPFDQKETARVMNRLLRAGYSSTAIFKLFKTWQIDLPEEPADDDGLPEF